MKKNKQCPNCKTMNFISAKFCEGCGTKLLAEATKQCNNCHAENPKNSKFCYQCGNSLYQNAPRKMKASPKTRHQKNRHTSKSALPVKPILYIAGLVAIISVIIISTESNPVNPNSLRTMVEQKSNDSALETAVSDIASKFICSCGSCGRQSLDLCTCDVAIVERDFIRKTLQKNETEENVIKAVNQKYGFIKDQYKHEYGPGKFIFDSKSALNLTPDLISSPKENMESATVDDRLKIISSFACTCGQCQIDELKDCNCNHPGGATEVKNFIDQKIEERKYSAENVIHLVEAKYGERIR